MAANSNITITLIVRDKATERLNSLNKQVASFRNEIKQFNRNLFTASALLATFGIAFKKITDIAKSGASFEYIRKQFADVFKPEYLFKLQSFSRGTVDALTIMQEALKMKSGNVRADYMENIFKMAPAFAKLLGKDAATVVRELGDAYRTSNQRLLQTYLTTLKVNNQFQVQNKTIAATTKHWASANLSWQAFSRIAMNDMMQKLVQLNKGGEDSVEIFMQYAAQAKNLKDQFGELVARGVSPLVKAMSQVTGKMFERLFNIMSSDNPQQKKIRNGLIDLTRHTTILTTSIIGLIASFSAFNILLAPLGFTLGGIAGVLTIALAGLRSFRLEGESWSQTFAKIGTVLQVFWEALSSFDPKSGRIMFSGQLNERFKSFSEDTRNRIWKVIKALITLKQTLIGIKNGFMSVIDTASKFITKLSAIIPFGDSKQMTKSWTSGAEGFGKVLGGALGIGLLLKGIKTLASGAFGLGKRGYSALLPLYVKDVGSLGGMIGKLGFLGKAGLVGLAGAAGYGLGTLLDNVPKFMGFERSYSDAISDFLVGENRKRHGDFEEERKTKIRGSYKSAIKNTSPQTDFSSSADMSSVDSDLAEEIARSNQYLKQIAANSKPKVGSPKDLVFLPNY